MHIRIVEMIRYINLLVTNRCNLSCLHCLSGKPDKISHFPVSLLEELLPQAMKFGGKHVGLTGGEPCLHPNFGGIVKTIVDFGYEWSFVSNGTSTDKYLPLMQKYQEKFGSVAISLDSTKPEVHDEIRNSVGVFEKAINSIKTYVSEGFKVKIKVSLNILNKGEIQPLVKLAKKLKVAEIQFSGTIPNAWNQYLVLSEKEQLDLYQEISSIRSTKKLIIHATPALYTKGGIYFCSYLSAQAISVLSNGDINFCCDIASEKSVVGSLNEFPLVELIQRKLRLSAELQIFRSKCINTGEMGDFFDTCAFCNSYFSNQIP